ncbi:MAG: phosphate/phosphite/phosphonate ABC transporter substrate-binding protein [Cyanothece sp. SIO2G6]|nr:phosphate/phosphite/phosphonate ABC transporter substrate-binding protein [Cyanothece sp. SIO2G6]
MKKRDIKRRDFLSLSLLFMMGCSFSKVQEIATSNYAGNHPERLRFAVTDVQGLETLETDYAPFRQALEKVVGIPIEFFPVENFIAAAPALLSGTVDLVFAGPSEYLILQAKTEARPLIAVTRPEYYSVISVRANSDIKDLADLKDKTVAMRAEGSTAGHIGAADLLLKAGLKFNEDFQVKMLGDEGLTALLEGQVDAWADSNSRYDRLVETANVVDQLRIISQGDGLPNDVFVVRKTLDPIFTQYVQKKVMEKQSILLTALASTPANDKYEQSEFIPAADEHYEVLREIYRAMGQEFILQ